MAAPDSDTGQGAVLDAAHFPHIMDKIVAHAPYRSLLALRAASKALRKRIDTLILEHILIWPKGRTSSRRGPHYRLPWADFAEDVWRVKCVRVVDVHPNAFLSEFLSPSSTADGRTL